MPTTNYPTSLDDGTSLPNPGSSDVLDSPTTNLLHHNQHDIENDAIKALETKVGVTNSQDSTSHDVRLRASAEHADYTITPSSIDDEFNATALSGSWTWQNQGTASASLAKGRLLLTAPSTVTGIAGITQTAPATTTWTVETQVAITTGNNHIAFAGILLRESASGHVLVWGIGNSAGTLEFFAAWATSLTGSQTSLNSGGNALQPYIYLRVNKTSTQYTMDYSWDGVAWINFASVNIATVFAASADEVGLYINPSSTTITVYASFDFFRRTA